MEFSARSVCELLDFFAFTLGALVIGPKQLSGFAAPSVNVANISRTKQQIPNTPTRPPALDRSRRVNLKSMYVRQRPTSVMQLRRAH